ncbi:MAG: DEAD/DEAH box helicase [Proteobacteria bacterium]|nr:DEAD/DEAH box helicase [Pseudomonadota bacterium]
MQFSVGRLSALPCFLKSPAFWSGALDPRTSIDDRARFGHLREFSSAHQWSLDLKEASFEAPSGTALTVVELALGILQRGAWTPCTWLVEQSLGEAMANAGLVTLQAYGAKSGLLGFDAVPTSHADLKSALVAGRLRSEASPDCADALWDSACQDSGFAGSEAERQFFDEVLVPALGFPLLDYLRFQPPLEELLGVNPIGFHRQRTDFSIDTGRGLRLVIEVDGRQHHEVAAQQHLDRSRDDSLRKSGWQIWRVPVADLSDPKARQAELLDLLARTRGGKWGLGVQTAPARSLEVMNAAWGATVVARIQFLVLVAMKRGLLLPERAWSLRVIEDDTDVAALAIADFCDWFGRLRNLYGLTQPPDIRLASATEDEIDLVIEISATNPHFAPQPWHCAIACSRPANWMADEATLRFSQREYLTSAPTKELLESFGRDLFRKAHLREGQYEILCRILQGRDVVGLLPTGGGKSLTYQLATMLLGGVTLYVAPLKSLLQDQYERMMVDGIDCCGFISSALRTDQRLEQERRFRAGRMRLLQVAPERFLMDSFRQLLSDYQSQFGPVSQVVVDECHCVSEWGHDFRPAYLSLSRIVRDRTVRLDSSAVVVALTGTASSVVLEDVRRELGILDTGAVIRARRLDRPELSLQFEKLPGTGKKPAMVHAVNSFLEIHRGQSGGLLLFTQHVNGPLGVYEIANEAVRSLSMLPGKDIRIYSGERPKALTDSISSAGWEVEKAQTQRDFINPRGDTFQVLVATSAFGMGIDKPTIRKVIHYLAPQSPEAYYQEVGRAGRDGEPAEALLLFSDEAAQLTDSLLSPETDIDEARRQHKAVKWGVPVGDFFTTFFFHANRFTGVEEETANAVRALEAIKHKVDAGLSIVLPYTSSRKDMSWNSEAHLEYALVRLIHLGVVLDYTKNFNARTLEVTLEPGWLSVRSDFDAYRERHVASMDTYVRRYETRRAGALLQPIEAAKTFNAVEEAALRAIVQYLYSQIERRRRTSTREMLEIAREGVGDPAKARQLLLFYLQASEKFTHALEQVAREETASMGWAKLAQSATSPVEVDELRGAATRVLESYPTHPALLFLSAITRRTPSAAELDRSKEEFQAAMKTLAETDADAAADAAEMALELCRGFDTTLVRQLSALYGAWSLSFFGPRFALERVGEDVGARLGIFKDMVANAQRGLPTLFT